MIHKLSKFRLSDGKAMLASALQNVRIFDRRSRFLMTLVALFAMTTGAWAQQTIVEWTPETWQDMPSPATTFTSGDITITATGTMGKYQGNIFLLISKWDDSNTLTFSTTGDPFTRIELTMTNEQDPNILPDDGWTVSGNSAVWEGEATKNLVCQSCTTTVSKITFYVGIPEPVGTDLTPDATRKIWTLDAMPAGNVELLVEYFDDAVLVDGDVAPAAPADPIYVSTDAALVTAPENNAVSQGTLMYLAQISTADAPTTTEGFSATVPTASTITEPGTYHVYYYIVGDDEHSNSAILGPVEVEVLTDKFDITFNAANANTIEAGKATVTVGGTAATVTEGKLEAVKMGSEVKMTAKQGYKFRKVEAKKPAATVTTAPTAKTGVKAGEDVAIVNEGAAEGGTMMYMVNATQPASTDGFSATVPTAEGLTAGTYYVWYYVKGDADHSDSEIAGPVSVTMEVAAFILGGEGIFTNSRLQFTFSANGFVNNVWADWNGTSFTCSHDEGDWYGDQGARVSVNGAIISLGVSDDWDDTEYEGFTVNFNTSNNTYTITKGDYAALPNDVTSVKVNGVEVKGNLTKQ